METSLYGQTANGRSNGVRKWHIICDCYNSHFKPRMSIKSLRIPGGAEGISGACKPSVIEKEY